MTIIFMVFETAVLIFSGESYNSVTTVRSAGRGAGSLLCLGHWGGEGVQTQAGHVTCSSLSASGVTLLSILVQKPCEFLWDMSCASAKGLDKTTAVPLGHISLQPRCKMGKKRKKKKDTLWF